MKKLKDDNLSNENVVKQYCRTIEKKGDEACSIFRAHANQNAKLNKPKNTNNKRQVIYSANQRIIKKTRIDGKAFTRY